MVSSQIHRVRTPRMRRPSVLDPMLSGDPWMGHCTLPGLLILDLNNYPVALQPGTPLDQASLNSWIFQLQHRTARLAG